MHEFDRFAETYYENLDSPLKRWAGISDRQLVAQKARLLIRLINQESAGDRFRSILDFGCGPGGFLHQIGSVAPWLSLSGYDPSPKMIDVAQNSLGPQVFLTHHLSELRDIHRGTFDVIVLSSVLHHVPSKDRGNLLCDVGELLSEDGILVVFEHNPRNPLTRFVVKRTPIDAGAVLLTPDQLERGDEKQVFTFSSPHYYLNLPPGWPVSDVVDRVFQKAPLGAQWAVVGKKRR